MALSPSLSTHLHCLADHILECVFRDILFENTERTLKEKKTCTAHDMMLDKVIAGG